MPASKPPFPFLLIPGIALLASCASPPEPQIASRPHTAPLRTTEHIEFHGSPTSVAALPAPAPRLRLEKPYVYGRLPDLLEFTPAEIEDMKNDIRAWLRAAHVPEGAEIELFSPGVATLDHWLHYGPDPTKTPPDKPPYYRMIYRDGRPFEAYRHDAKGVGSANKIYYAEGMIPVCAVHYDAESRPVRYAHLAYDDRGLIKRVVVIDRTGKPVFALCHAHRDAYLNGEYKTYSFDREGEVSTHIIQEESFVYLVQNGVRRQVNRGSLLHTLTRLETHGVRPFYPLPADFIRPADLEPWKSEHAAAAR